MICSSPRRTWLKSLTCLFRCMTFRHASRIVRRDHPEVVCLTLRLEGIQPVIERAEWPVAVLAAAPDGKLTPVQMQKVLFLLRQEAASQVGPDFYSFEPYNYGPFSKVVYEDIEHAASDGLVQVVKEPGQRWGSYVLTATGKGEGDQLMSRVDDNLREYVKSLVLWTKSLSFSQLVGSIYAKYPDYAVNSIFSK